MDLAHAGLSQLSLDPKRIAGTSVAISLHVAVLLLLLLPAQTAPTRATVENPMTVVVPEIKRVVPTVPITHPRPVQPITRSHPTAPPILQDPAEDSVSPVDPYVPPSLPDTTPADKLDGVSTTPAFAQISADLAPPPPYPIQALHRHVTGVVTLRVRVDAQGRPTEVIVEHSSGSTLLDQAALKFVRARWHFVPATRDGVAIEAFALVPIDFVID